MNDKLSGSVHGCASRKSISTVQFSDPPQRFAKFCRLAAQAGALILAAPLLAAAQGTPVPARITAQIDETRLTTLRGNTHPLARPQYDQGAVADSQPLRRMLLLLKRSPEQETALRTLLDEQQSKSSPNFHKWLTPQQFGQQFGPSDADIQTVTSWLASHGFQVARVSTGKILIEFSGTAGQVRNAFHTEIHRYLVNGETRFANSGDPQIPTALTPVVAGPVSLHNFPKKPQLRNKGIFRRTKSTGKVTPLYTFSGCPTVTGAGSNCNALGPGDFATIYSVPSTVGGSPAGTGQTIAIVGDSEICTANSPDFGTSYIGPNGNLVTCSSDDVATFRSQFGLSAISPNVILDGPDPGFNGDETEGDLDVQWSGAIAPNATIDFVIAEGTEASAGVDLAAEHVVDNNLAPVMSESFGDCESNLGNSGNAFYDALWQQAAGQGITVIVASDDNGSAGCDNPNTESEAVNGIAVNGIASTPFNVATGGTDFDTSSGSSYQSTYWSGTNRTGQVSALSYIPETTWNDSCAQNFAQLVTTCNSVSSGSSLNIVAGGGGQSQSQIYLKPSWQPIATGSNLTAANDGTRDLPDIAIFSADGLVSNSFYVVCETDLNSSGQPCDISAPFFDFVGIGGTSSAAPTFAGMMALVNQSMGANARQGNANYVLYNLAATQTSLNCNSSAPGGPNSACTFNDVTKGNISVPCPGSAKNCSTNSGTGMLVNNNMPAWEAGLGFDLATGLGSVNATNLITNWSSAVGSFKSTTTTLCMSTSSSGCPNNNPQPVSIQHGTGVFVYITVKPPSGSLPNNSASTPEAATLIGTFAGGTKLAVDRFDVKSGNVDTYPLTNGVSSGVNSGTNELIGGTYTVTAHYPGDGTYGASDSNAVSVTVSPEGSTAAVSTKTVNLFTGAVSTVSSAPYGSLDLVRVDVTGTSSNLESAAGTVTLTDNGAGIVDPNGTPTSTFTLNSEGYLEDQTALLAVGSHSLQAQYNGDASYSAMSTPSTAVTFTVTKASTTSSFIQIPNSVLANTPFSISAFVDTQTSSGGSLGVSPTGTVTFYATTSNGMVTPDERRYGPGPNPLVVGEVAAALACLLLLSHAAKKRRGAVLLASAILAVIAVGTSCGSGGGGNNNTTTTPLGTVSVTGTTTDANGFAATTATINNVTLSKTATITVTYNGDSNYNSSTSSGATVTVQ